MLQRNILLGHSDKKKRANRETLLSVSYTILIRTLLKHVAPWRCPVKANLPSLPPVFITRIHWEWINDSLRFLITCPSSVAGLLTLKSPRTFCISSLGLLLGFLLSFRPEFFTLVTSFCLPAGCLLFTASPSCTGWLQLPVSALHSVSPPFVHPFVAARSGLAWRLGP